MWILIVYEIVVIAVSAAVLHAYGNTWTMAVKLIGLTLAVGIAAVCAIRTSMRMRHAKEKHWDELPSVEIVKSIPARAVRLQLKYRDQHTAKYAYPEDR